MHSASPQSLMYHPSPPSPPQAANTSPQAERPRYASLPHHQYAAVCVDKEGVDLCHLIGQTPVIASFAALAPWGLCSARAVV